MTATQAAPPRVQGLAAAPLGGGRAWPDRETTRQARPQHTRPHWCEGRRRDLPRCRWAVAGPGRIARQRAKPDLSTPGPTGVEGAGGICRGAGGRRRGLAGLRDDAPSEARSADGSRAGRRPPAHTAAGPSGARNTRGATRQHSHTVAGPSGARNTSSARNTSGATRHLGITKPPGPTGAGRLSQYQRLIAGPQQCRGLRGRSPGERWKYRAWRQRPSRFPPCGDPRRRRWRSAWPSRRRSRRRCLRSRPG